MHSYIGPQRGGSVDRPRLVPVAAVAAAVFWSAGVLAKDLLADFKHPLDGSKIDFKLKPGEAETPALKKFKETGANEYRNDPRALAEGRELYEQWCSVCHNTDGSGKMGPSLIAKDYAYPQSATDPGMFSIIYAGAAGAMQPFSKRDVTQDQMLKIVAYVRSLAK